MHTESLIEMLARGAGPAPRAVTLRRLLPVAVLGLAASVLLAVGLFGLISIELFGTAAPWIKLVYAASMTVAAGWLAAHLSRPISRLAGPRLLTAAIVAAMVAFGLSEWLAASPELRRSILFGRSWFACPVAVLGLSLPTLAAALWAIRGLAPTRLRAAGFAAGLFAGAVGAFGYALSCPESSSAFIAVWYTLGMISSGVVGALLGPRVLRW